VSDEASESTSNYEAELARLKAENAALRAEADGRQKSGRSARRWISVILAVVAAVVVPLAALTVWTQRTVLDTDQYVDTVGPLARDEAVQNRVAEVLTTEINAQVDFESLLEETLDEAGLPDDLREPLGVLVGPLAGGAESIVERVVSEIVRSDAFAELWEEANRAGHEVVVAVLTGEGADNIETDGGRIRLTFDGLLEQANGIIEGILGPDLTERLGLEDVETEVVLLESDDLAAAQELVDLLDTLSWFVPLIALLLLALVIIVSNDRRLGVRRAGLAILISSLLTLALLAFVRNRAGGAAEDEAAARAVIDQLLTFLLQELRALVVLGAVLLFGAWLAGPTSTAGKVRAWGNSLLGRASAVEDPTEVGAFPVWVARRHAALLAGALVLGGLALIIADRPTGWTVLWIAALTGLLMLGIEAITRVGIQAAAAADSIRPADTADADAPAAEAPDAEAPDAEAPDADHATT